MNTPFTGIMLSIFVFSFLIQLSESNTWNVISQDNCLEHRSICLRDERCSFHFETFERTCGYSLSSCSVPSPSDCVVVIRKIRDFFPYQKCVCYEALGLTEDCDFFRELIWNHPCERRLKDAGRKHLRLERINNRPGQTISLFTPEPHRRRTTRVPLSDQVQQWKSQLSGDLETREMISQGTCNEALNDVCLTHVSCRQLWRLFRSSCGVDEENKCTMADREICWQSFEGLTWTGLGNCRCDSNNSDCHWIRLHTNYNKCIYEISKSGQQSGKSSYKTAQQYQQRYETRIAEDNRKQEQHNVPYYYQAKPTTSSQASNSRTPPSSWVPNKYSTSDTRTLTTSSSYKEESSVRTTIPPWFTGLEASQSVPSSSRYQQTLHSSSASSQSSTSAKNSSRQSAGYHQTTSSPPSSSSLPSLSSSSSSSTSSSISDQHKVFYRPLFNQTMENNQRSTSSTGAISNNYESTPYQRIPPNYPDRNRESNWQHPLMSQMTTPKTFLIGSNNNQTRFPTYTPPVQSSSSDITSYNMYPIKQTRKMNNSESKNVPEHSSNSRSDAIHGGFVVKVRQQETPRRDPTRDSTYSTSSNQNYLQRHSEYTTSTRPIDYRNSSGYRTSAPKYDYSVTRSPPSAYNNHHNVHSGSNRISNTEYSSAPNDRYNPFVYKESSSYQKNYITSTSTPTSTSRTFPMTTTTTTTTTSTSSPFPTSMAHHQESRIEFPTKFQAKNPASSSSCQLALSKCDQTEDCRWHLGELRVRCARPSCRREDCAAALQRFSRYVPYELVEAIMFCQCSAYDVNCSEHQDVLYPKCLYASSQPVPTCTQTNRKCEADPKCRHLLRSVASFCPVSNGECITSNLTQCRQTLLTARASILEQPCFCPFSDVECISYQRLMIPNNPCIEKSMLDYSRVYLRPFTTSAHTTEKTPSNFETNRVQDILPLYKSIDDKSYRVGEEHGKSSKVRPLTTSTTTQPMTTTLPEEVAKQSGRKTTKKFRTTTASPPTTSEAPPPWITTTTSAPTTTTTFMTHAPPPPEGCTTRDANGRWIFAPVGTVIRRYVDWSGRCSSWCECVDENELACQVVPCLEEGRCEAPLTFVEFGERIFLKDRGACFCESSQFICEYPEDIPELYPGLYISAGYSGLDVEMLRKEVPSHVLEKAGFLSADGATDIASRLQIAFERLLPDDIQCRVVLLPELSDVGSAFLRVEWYGMNKLLNHTKTQWHYGDAEKVCSPYVVKLADQFAQGDSLRYQLVLSTVKQIKVIDYLDGLPKSAAASVVVSILRVISLIVIMNLLS